MKNQKILDSLQEITTEEKVNSIFSKGKITDPKTKLEYLQDIQGMESFYTPNYDTLSDEEKYDYELEIFLIGDWKKNRLYEKMGL